jgi:SAM-dependent methyltransferase
MTQLMNSCRGVSCCAKFRNTGVPRPPGCLFAIIQSLALSLALVSSNASAQETESAAAPGSVVAEFASEVDKVLPFVAGEWTKRWVAEAPKLEKVRPRGIKVADRDVVVDELLFYSGRYGSPLSYARALDLAEKHGFSPQTGTRVFDFGYGSIGHLRMLAQQGIHVTAVDVDPLLPVMYEKSTGPYAAGHVTLLNGQFPAEEPLVQQAGINFDLVISKNTLKRGYIHPARKPASPRHVIELGVTDEKFLAQIAGMLKPGGVFLIYNFCPRKAAPDKPYIPWADGESPFSKEQFAAAGLEVLEFDVVDDKPARELGRLLGWDAPGGMNLETDLFAWYTVARRK